MHQKPNTFFEKLIRKKTTEKTDSIQSSQLGNMNHNKSCYYYKSHPPDYSELCDLLKQADDFTVKTLNFLCAHFLLLCLLQ